MGKVKFKQCFEMCIVSTLYNYLNKKKFFVLGKFVKSCGM